MSRVLLFITIITTTRVNNACCINLELDLCDLSHGGAVWCENEEWKFSSFVVKRRRRVVIITHETLNLMRIFCVDDSQHSYSHHRQNGDERKKEYEMCEDSPKCIFLSRLRENLKSQELIHMALKHYKR